MRVLDSKRSWMHDTIHTPLPCVCVGITHGWGPRAGVLVARWVVVVARRGAARMSGMHALVPRTMGQPRQSKITQSFTKPVAATAKAPTPPLSLAGIAL